MDMRDFPIYWSAVIHYRISCLAKPLIGRSRSMTLMDTKETKTIQSGDESPHSKGHFTTIAAIPPQDKSLPERYSAFCGKRDFNSCQS